MGLAGVVFVLRVGTCFKMPELSASIIFDKLSESGGPGDGVHTSSYLSLGWSAPVFSSREKLVLTRASRKILSPFSSWLGLWLSNPKKEGDLRTLCSSSFNDFLQPWHDESIIWQKKSSICVSLSLNSARSQTQPKGYVMYYMRLWKN